MRSLVATLMLAAGAGCLFSPSIPKDARITCTNSADCPDAKVCVGVGTGTCVDPDAIDRAAPNATITLDRDSLAALDTLHVDVEVDEALASVPVLQVGGATIDADDLTGPFAFEVPAADIGDGVHAVTVVLVDATGNVGVAVGGVVDVDVTAPALVAGSLDVALFAPPFAASTTATSLTLFGRAEVAFTASETLGAEPIVVASDGGVDLPLTLTRADGQRYTFEIVLEEEVPEGDYTIDLELVDARGNAAAVHANDEPRVPITTAAVPLCTALHTDGTPACTDADGDGYDGASVSCTPVIADCDDTTALKRPAGVDVPGDLVDGDCSGADEPIDLDRVVYVDPDALAGPGTADAPTSLLDALSRHDAVGVTTILARTGRYDLPAGSNLLNSSLIGGLDADWAPSGTSELFFPTSGAALLRVDNDTGPARLERLRIVGSGCTALTVDTAPAGEADAAALDIAHVSVADDAQSCLGAIGIELFDRRVLLSDVDVTLVSDRDGTGIRTAIGGTAAVRIIDSAVHVDVTTYGIGFYSAQPGPLDLVRSSVVVNVSGGFASGIDVDGPSTLVGVYIEANASGGAEALETRAAVVVHSTIVAVGGASASGVIVQATNTQQERLFILGSIVDVHGATAASLYGLQPYARLRAVGNAHRLIDDAGAPCWVDDASCHTEDDLTSCTFPECLQVSESVAYDGTAAPTVALLDEGAPSSLAMDADGDCRGADDVEAGADELP